MTTEEKKQRKNERSKERYANDPVFRAKCQAKARAAIGRRNEKRKVVLRQQRALEGRAVGERLFKYKKPLDVVAQQSIMAEYEREWRIIKKEERGVLWWKEKSVLLAVQAARTMAAYYALTPEERRKRAKERNAKITPEKQAEYNRRYYERLKQNPEKIREMRRKYRKGERQRMKPHQKAKENLRNRFRKRLKQFNITKWDSFSTLLGCNWSFFVQWMEKQWAKGMSWGNYGSAWHIDHIEPLAVFDVDDKEQMRRAWHYTNLRPLWARENMDKSDSIIIHQPELTLSISTP